MITLNYIYTHNTTEYIQRSDPCSLSKWPYPYRFGLEIIFSNRVRTIDIPLIRSHFYSTYKFRGKKNLFIRCTNVCFMLQILI